MSNSGHVIKCPESLTIAAVADFKGELATALETQSEIVLNGGNVDAADTAALQLLCALFLDAASHDIDIRWEDASQTLRNSAKTIGVSGIIGLENSTVH